MRAAGDQHRTWGARPQREFNTHDRGACERPYLVRVWAPIQRRRVTDRKGSAWRALPRYHTLHRPDERELWNSATDQLITPNSFVGTTTRCYCFLYWAQLSDKGAVQSQAVPDRPVARNAPRLAAAPIYVYGANVYIGFRRATRRKVVKYSWRRQRTGL
jgi:hypothetical protein